jgi:hypothetical protein
MSAVSPVLAPTSRGARVPGTHDPRLDARTDADPHDIRIGIPLG